MGILALLVSLVAAASVWWWRLRMLKRASDTVIDAAERFRGRQKRRRMAGEVELSSIAAIDSPVTAAATLIRLVLGREAWPEAQGEVKARLAELSTEAMAEDAVTYAEWALRQPVPAEKSRRMLIDILRERLTAAERRELTELLESAAWHGDRAIRAEASRTSVALTD